MHPYSYFKWMEVTVLVNDINPNGWYENGSVYPCTMYISMTMTKWCSKINRQCLVDMAAIMIKLATTFIKLTMMVTNLLPLYNGLWKTEQAVYYKYKLMVSYIYARLFGCRSIYGRTLHSLQSLIWILYRHGNIYPNLLTVTIYCNLIVMFSDMVSYTM